MFQKVRQWIPALGAIPGSPQPSVTINYAIGRILDTGAQTFIEGFMNIGSISGTGNYTACIYLPEWVIKSIIANGFDGRASGTISTEQGFIGKPVSLEFIDGQNYAIMRKINVATGQLSDALLTSDIGANSVFEFSGTFLRDCPADATPFQSYRESFGNSDVPCELGVTAVHGSLTVPIAYYTTQSPPYKHMARSKVFRDCQIGDRLFVDWVEVCTWTDPSGDRAVESSGVVRIRNPNEAGPLTVIGKASPALDPYMLSESTGGNNIPSLHHITQRWTGDVTIGDTKNGITLVPGDYVVDGFIYTGSSDPTMDGLGVTYASGTMRAWSKRPG